MGTIVEQTGAYSTVNVGMVLLAVALLVGSGALVVSGVIGFRRSRKTIERAFALVAIGVGPAILMTIVLAGLEVLPEAALWPLLFFELGSLSLLFWVWMLVDCAVNELTEGNDKLVWVLIILFAHVLGAALYLLVRRPRRLAEVGR